MKRLFAACAAAAVLIAVALAGPAIADIKFTETGTYTAGGASPNPTDLTVSESLYADFTVKCTSDSVGKCMYSCPLTWTSTLYYYSTTYSAWTQFPGNSTTGAQFYTLSGGASKDITVNVTDTWGSKASTTSDLYVSWIGGGYVLLYKHVITCRCSTCEGLPPPPAQSAAEIIFSTGNEPLNLYQHGGSATVH